MRQVRRRTTLIRLSAIGAAAWLGVSRRAYPRPDIPRIGVLLPEGLEPTLAQLLKQGLATVGYRQDENITIDWRAFQDPGVQLRSLAQDLVAGKVDLIVALGTPAARAAMSATTSIPVVFLSGDPIASNLADSLSHPGRNATGVSILSPELTAKRLEYLHMVAPRARRIIYLMSTTNQLEVRQYEALSNAARDLGLKVAALICARPEELDGVLSTLERDPPDGLVVSGNALFLDGRRKVTAAVRAIRRPAIFPYREYHDQGVLMSYGPSAKDNMHRVALYVDRILKGGVPAQLPIEQSTKLDLVVDLRVARAMHIAMPDTLLALADEVLR